ncbi:hypothetical protein Tco_0116964 [Tanacetum coccineum]
MKGICKSAHETKATVVPKKTATTFKKKQSKRKFGYFYENQMNLKENQKIGQLEERKGHPEMLSFKNLQFEIDTQKAIKASKRTSRFQHQIGGLNEGVATSPEVLDESRDKNEARYDLDDWGSTDDEKYLLAYKDEKPEDIPWQSTDDDESENDDEEDDASIGIEKTDDERTNTDIEYQAEEEQKGDDQAGDEQLVVPISTTQKETPSLLQSTSSHSGSSNFDVPNIQQELLHAVKVSIYCWKKRLSKELKQADHSTTILASIRSQVPSVVKEYLGSRLPGAFQKVLRSHTEELKKELSKRRDYKDVIEESYEIPYDNSDPVNRFVPDREETLTLEKESSSKLNRDLVKPYDYTKQNSLYEIFKPASKEYHDLLAHANEVRKKMWRKSFVKTKPKFFKNISFLPNSKSISKSRQAYNVMKNNINHFRELVDQAWEKDSHDHFCAPTTQDMEILIKTCLMPLGLKTQNDSFTFVHELKQEMHADLKYVESLEKKLTNLNLIKLNFQTCMICFSKMKECECLAQKLSKQTETVSKEVYNKLSRSFAKLEKHSISLELALQHYLKAQLQDKNIAISELKKLIEKCKGKSVETKIDKPSVVRQPNAQRIPKQLVLGKPALFSDSLERKSFSKTKSVPKTNVSESLSKPVTT